MTANTATDKDLANLRKLADGQKIHHASRKRLDALGLIREDGQLSGDAEFILAGMNPEPAETAAATSVAKKAKTAKAKRCADCDVLLTSRTRGDHDDLCSYCAEAGGMENEHADGMAEVGDHPEGCHECGTYDAGAHWDAVPAKAAKASKRIRSTSPRKCACDCGGVTSGGLWLPGHDARRAGQVGRMLAQDIDTADLDELVARASEFLPAGADKLAAKAARVALNAITKAKAKRAA